MDVSAALRPFLAEVWEDRQPLLRRVAHLVTTQLPTYSASPSSEIWIGMTRILERTMVGDPFEPPTEADRAAANGTGVQGGGTGIAAEDLVAAVLLGAREVEAEVMNRARAAGVDAETRLAGTVRARAWAEQVAVWAAEALGRAGQRPGGDRHLVGGLIAALREHRSAAEIRACADRLGFDVAAPRYAVVARGTTSGFAVDAAALRFTHSGSGAWSDEPETLIGIVGQRPYPTGSLVIGVAGPRPLTDLATALTDAERASRVAVRLRGPGVHTLDDLGLLTPLHEDPALLARLRHRWLTPLLSEPRHDLASTVRCWQGHGGSVDEVARDLAVHPNTVRNRLARVDSLLGSQWRTPQCQAEIWAALLDFDRDS